VVKQMLSTYIYFVQWLVCLFSFAVYSVTSHCVSGQRNVGLAGNIGRVTLAQTKPESVSRLILDEWKERCYKRD
jgi:hypothetical protein